MDEDLLFYIALSLMLMHEMDTIRCQEWRIFPVLSMLDGPHAFRFFMIAHLPIYYLLIWLLISDAAGPALVTGLDIFFLLHLMLHLVSLRNPANEFTDWLSWGLIGGTAGFGGAHLLSVLV